MIFVQREGEEQTVPYDQLRNGDRFRFLGSGDVPVDPVWTVSFPATDGDTIGGRWGHFTAVFARNKTVDRDDCWSIAMAGWRRC